MGHSITSQTMKSVKAIWQKELSNSHKWLETEKYETILEFLNNRENICTPGFILRRHIQVYFPEILSEALTESKISEYAELTKSVNVKWDKKLVKALARILSKTEFKLIKNLNIDNHQWENFLNDATSCNRATAIKIIFALNLDDTTATKFLIADGKNLFSVRNPEDYLYNFCHQCHFTYETALELLEKFESDRQLFDAKTNSAPTNQIENATTLMENETQRISSNVKLSDEEKQRQILKVMHQYRAEFVKKISRKNGDAEYSSGFSKQHSLKLKVFLKYLTDMYPNFLQYEVFSHTEKNGETVDESYLREKEIPRNKDGSPASPINLTDAMIDSQEIYICKLEELAELGLLNKSKAELVELGLLRGKTPTDKKNQDEKNGRKIRVNTKREYNEFPFNNEIILPLKNLSQTLRSNLRTDNPDNAQDVERSTILFLAYFFICGCCLRNDKDLKNLHTKLKNDIKADKDAIKNNVRYALQNVVKNILELNQKKNKISLFVKSLNQLLKSFGCNEFYAPFVIDRCILLCLLTVERTENVDDYPEYLMAKIVEQSYTFSKEKIESANQPLQANNKKI